jgi:hypothetical protein
MLGLKGTAGTSEWNNEWNKDCNKCHFCTCKFCAFALLSSGTVLYHVEQSHVMWRSREGWGSQTTNPPELRRLRREGLRKSQGSGVLFDTPHPLRALDSQPDLAPTFSQYINLHFLMRVENRGGIPISSGCTARQSDSNRTRPGQSKCRAESLRGSPGSNLHFHARLVRRFSRRWRTSDACEVMFSNQFP